jgi:hypothetical protein
MATMDGAAEQRAQLYDDIRDAFEQARVARLHSVDEDLAFIADKLWEKGWRQVGESLEAVRRAEEAVRRGMADVEESVQKSILAMGMESLQRHHPGLYEELRASGELRQVQEEIDKDG